MNALPRILARFTFLRCLALLGLMLGAASSAFATKTYSDNGDGTVTDPTTGLQWMRCAMGQTGEIFHLVAGSAASRSLGGRSTPMQLSFQNQFCVHFQSE